MVWVSPKPAKVLEGNASVIDIDRPFGYDDGSGNDPYIDAPYRVIFDITVQSRSHGNPNYQDFNATSAYDALDIRIGDWVSSEQGAKCYMIRDILLMQSDSVRVVLEDVGRYNSFQHSSPYMQDGYCLIFEVDDNMMPALFPLPDILSGQIGFTWASQILSRFQAWKSQFGIAGQQINNDFAVGTFLKIATAAEVEECRAIGSNTSPSVTAGEVGRVNNTLVEWPTLSTPQEIVDFLNSLNLSNGRVQAEVDSSNAINLFSPEGDDIYVQDVGSATTFSVGLGLLSASNGVFAGKFIPISSPEDYPCAIVTRRGTTPHEFYYDWLGSVSDIEAAASTIQIGEVADLSEITTGISQQNVRNGAIKISSASVNRMIGKTGGATNPANLFVLNKVLVSFQNGVGDVDDAVASIIAANIPDITAQNIGGALSIENTAGGKIQIWDDVAGDITKDFGIRNFQPAKTDKFLILQESSTLNSSGISVNQYTLEADETEQYALAGGAIADDPTLPEPGEDITTIIYHGYRAPTNFRTKTISGFTPARQGTLLAIQNGSVVGSRVLNSGGNNVGTYGSLVIDSDDGIFLSGHIEGTAEAGLNVVQIDHGRYGSTNIARFVYDDIAQTPTVTATTFDETSTVNLTYSSGIPHYGEGSQFDVGADLSNLAKYTYVRDDIAEVSVPPALSETINVGESGIPSILPFDAAPQTLVHTMTIEGKSAGSGPVLIRARNALGWSEAGQPPTFVNILSGANNPEGEAEPVREMHIYVDPSLGSAVTGAADVAERIGTSAGDTPADDFTALLSSSWDSTAALAVHEAPAVGGTIRHSQTNYSTWSPTGPDLSGHDASQYFTVMFRRAAVADFQIVLDDMASYSGCWVKLPGITDTTNAANGWWDMFGLFRLLGTPGDNVAAGGNGGNGCALNEAMEGTGGTYTCTFGQQNSSNSANNIILVRFKLTSGQQIRNLAFMAAS